MTKMAGGPEVEEAGGGDVAGAPAVRFSARRKRWSRRISWVLRVAVRSTVATANGVGDDELRSGACRERAEEGTGSRGREGRCRGRGGVRGALGCLQRRAGKQEVAGACARASGTRPPAYWQEVEDGGDRGGLGRTVLDQHRSWAGSGGLHG